MSPRWAALAVIALGCRGEGDKGEPLPESRGDSTMEEEPITALVSPAEAIDEDPAAGAFALTLTAAPATHVLPGGEQIEGYAYNGQTPGPTIRVSLGDKVTVTLVNQLQQTTTVHWHGLVTPWEADGATWMLGGVAPGESRTVSFIATEAGTFWYHPHMNTDQQVDAGLYGVLIVEDPAEPRVQNERVIVLDDWILPRPENGAIDSQTPDSASPTPPHGETGGHGESGDEGLWLVNGLIAPTASVPSGEALRARVLNASNRGYVKLSGALGAQIASDQGLLDVPQTPDTLLLAPGDRVELLWSLGAEGVTVWDLPYSHAGGPVAGDESALFLIEPEGDAAATAPPTFAHPGQAVSVDPGFTTLTYTFAGDDGKWFINGEQYPEVTVGQVIAGQPIVIEARNLSGVEHPVHLHGMAFEVLSVNGVAPTSRVVEDTFNLRARDRARLLVTPTEPGYWMVHCHILEHEEGGMMTVLEVVEGP
ncbi:multicopper oxidase family protein [Myxococcota bacterium]|nr:multicopper oxidase family protein [Myxococcota bacterium]